MVELLSCWLVPPQLTPNPLVSICLHWQQSRKSPVSIGNSPQNCPCGILYIYLSSWGWSNRDHRFLTGAQNSDFCTTSLCMHGVRTGSNPLPQVHTHSNYCWIILIVYTIINGYKKVTSPVHTCTYLLCPPIPIVHMGYMQFCPPPFLVRTS